MSDQLPGRISGQSTYSLRPRTDGAEKWLQRPIPCLNHGFVYLLDYMGNDEAIAQAARVSYGEGTQRVNTDEGLIRYLLRHAHTTPFEMVEFKFHCKMPIFVARQWIRHRMASVNEYSGRYSEMLDEFYIPEYSILRKQSKTNKQGRSEELTPEQQQLVLEILKRQYSDQYSSYRRLLDEFDLAKELARMGLSVANYTQWYWKIDLHNLMHFLRLRLDDHAQHEIQVYGRAITRIVGDSVPIAYRAFQDYRLNAISLSGSEIEIMASGECQFLFWHGDQWSEHGEKFLLERMPNKREREEFLEKLKKLRFVREK